MLLSVKKKSLSTLQSMQESAIKVGRRHLYVVILAATLMTIISACSGSQSKQSGDAQPQPQPYVLKERFHADNDIAMTLRSLADAIKVGEPLDSAEYDFEGVLTDGQGTPLYTDVQGAPGQWVVDVLDTKNVMIRNIYVGDILPLALQSYILSSLGISEENEMDFTAHEAVDDDETEINVYDCNGAYLRFEVRAGIAPNGIEGPQLSIIMSADPPAGVETRKDGLAQNVAMS